MKFVLNEQYESQREWLEHLPQTFGYTGEIVYDARNQIRRINGLMVKRFHIPSLFNRIIYTYFRTPKAARAYQNGLYLLSHGISTPVPIAYLLDGTHLLRESYLITKESRLPHLMREFTLDYRPELDELIRPFARFTARMHNAKILHLDYSPGNILWDKISSTSPSVGTEKEEDYRFEVIDINRMMVGKEVSLQAGCKSMRRICARTSFFRIFADEYARVRGFDPIETEQTILYYRDRFWANGEKARYQYD